jgi:hypothetical protein
MYETMPPPEELLERCREVLAMRSPSYIIDAQLFARALLRAAERPLLTHVFFKEEGPIGPVTHIVFTTADNAVMLLPSSFMPHLSASSPAQRANWQLVDRGERIQWLDVDAPARSFAEISLDTVLGLWDRVKEGT